MGYTLPQIAVILAKADRTMYKIGAIAYDDMFNQLDESLDYDRDIIYIYKVAVEYADNFYVGTDKLDTVVERLGAKVAVYDFGQLTPIYSDSTIVTQVVPVGAALNDLSDVTITNLQDQQTLKYNAALGQWVNVGTGNAVRNTQQFTATSGQTTFTTAYQFDGGLVDIFVNGVKLSTPSYTVFGNYTIILTDGCVSGDIVEIVAYENNIAFIDLSAYYVPVGRTITINGVTYDLSANRSWTTVSSVGISMPSAFTVSNSPVTTSGTLTVTGAGTTAQYIRGDGSLATFPALTGYVPYTGASGDVNLGEFELKAGQVEFDQTPTGAAGIAVMRWNDTDGTVDLGLKGGNVTLQMGQELVQRVVNKSGASLLESAYQVVKVITAQGQRLAIDLAQGNNDANSADTLGIVTETISNNQEGFITTSGLVRNINTTGSLQGETWADGDVLYLSPTVPGAITKVKPIAPNHSVILGYVVYAHANNGKIFVKVDNGYEIGELHDVNTTGAVNGNVLKYNGTIWIPSSDTGITSLNGLTALSQTFATGISGTDFGISSSTSTHTFNLPIASGTNTGKLSSTDWSTFNGKQNAITLTTTGTSGASTLVGSTLNIPQYADQFVGTVTSVAALTLGTTGTDLSSTVANGTTTPVITLNVPTASATNRGVLSSVDWTIFNNKVGGSGTINYLPKFTSASTIGDSLIYESSGVVNVGGQINITTGQALTLGLQNLQLPTGVASTISAGLSVRTGVANESIIQFGNNLNAYYTGLVDASRAGAMIRLDTRGVAPIPGASAYSVFQIQTRAAGVADPNYTVPVQIAAAPSGSFCIDINGYGYFYNRLRIGNTTTAPTEALSVTGNGVFTSNVTAASLIKSGGTSSQFLKADGSVDSSSYQPLLTNPVTGTGTTNYLPKWTSASAIGNSQIFDNGTNVGIGTATPQSILEIAQATPVFRIQASANDQFHGIEFRHDAGFDAFIKHLPYTAEFRISTGRGAGWGGHTTFYTDSSERMRLTSGGNLLVGTSVDSGDRLQVNGSSRLTGASGQRILTVNAPTDGGTITFETGTTAYADIGSQKSIFGTGSATDLFINTRSGWAFAIGTSNVARLSIATTGESTFSSSVTATSLVKSGGTSSQYLMADGSTSTLTNPVTGTGTTNYLPKFTGTSTIGNSLVYDDGSGVRIGAITHALASNRKLTVVGVAAIEAVATGTGGEPTIEMWQKHTSGDNLFAYFFTEATATTRGYLQYDRTGNRLNLVGSGNGLLFTGAATFSSSVTATSFIPSYNTSYYATDGTISNYNASNYLYVNGNAGGGLFLKGEGAGINNIRIESSISNLISFQTNGSERLRITSGGNLLLNSTTDNGNRLQVTGNGYFSGNVGIGVSASGYRLSVLAPFTGAIGGAYIEQGEFNQVTIRVKNTNPSASANLIEAANSSGNVFILSSTGAATFSSSVTATSFIKSGGTSSQYLMADGSVTTGGGGGGSVDELQVALLSQVYG